MLESPRQQSFSLSLACLIVAALVCFLFQTGAAQTTAESQSQTSPDDLKKFSGLLTQLGGLLQKMQTRVESPALRNQSRLLSLLPESTLVYVALPNYGEASHQALAVFQQEVKDNAQLRAWWQQGEMATEGPKIEENLEKFYQLSQYLGDEVVISAASSGKQDPKFLLLAELRKPGLKDFLRQALKELAGKAKPAARVVDAAELATAKSGPPDEPVILVLPDLVVLAESLDVLRAFNARREHPTQDFAATEFGQRLAQGYEGGATIIAGADFQRIFKLSSSNVHKDPTFQRTGFSDLKYLVWEHKNVAGQAASQMELSFTGPRRGVASWLAVPGPMNSLDFVSPKAMVALSLLLKNPAQIFDDVKELATASNPNALASLSQAEEQMKLSLRDDLFSRLAGEITLEMDRLTPTEQKWKLLLKTNDSAGLLATLNKFFAASQMTPGNSEEDGVTYYTVPIPSSPKPQEIAYAIVESYLIIGSSRAAVAEAVHLHGTGESLAKSSKFQAALPPGNLAEMSALLYEDPVAMAALSMRQASPEMAALFSQSTTETTPAVICGYGDESALREASRSGSVDAGAALVVAAIAIPNLLRARTAANEASAVGMVRTVDTAQITYASAYPQRGFARDLASLGPDPRGSSAPSADHASVIDATLGNASCTDGSWCTKSGFQFSLAATCKQHRCDEFVVVSTPANSNTGSRSFCSTSDAVVRYRLGPPLTAPISASECLKWAPLQ